MIVIDYRQLLDKIDNPPYTLYSAGDRAAWLDECITTAHAFDAEPVKQDTELSSILQDYGIKDTDTLRYILDQYQKIIVEITGGVLSKLVYPAKTVIAYADDNYHKEVENETD